MPTIVTIDESTTGCRDSGPELSFSRDAVSVRELIEHRVRTEVERYNLQTSGPFRGLIVPTELEQQLNERKNASASKEFISRRHVDVDKQVAVALDAFEKGSLLLLLPGRQAEDLEEEVRIRDGDSVSFLRLVPLIGG